MQHVYKPEGHMMEIEMYEYKRGLDWSVKCIVNGRESITYAAMVTPEGASIELKEKFIAEAETAVLKQLEVAEHKKYAYD